MFWGLAFIVFFICLILYFGAEKAFIVFFGLCILGCQYSLSGPFTIEDALILIFAAFPLTDANIVRRLRGYPFWICTGLYVFSAAISSIYTKVPPHYGLAFFDALRITMLPLLFFYYVRTRQDLCDIAIMLAGISVFGFSLALMDEVLDEKIYLNFIRTYFQSGVGWEMIGKRYGFERAQAFCLQAVSYGYICMTLLTAYLLFLNKYSSKMKLSKLSLFAVVFSCVCGCLLSGSRSSIFPLGIFLMYFYGLKVTSLQNTLLIIVLVITVYYIFGDYIVSIGYSIFNSNESSMGSSSEMRLEQLDISIFYFMKSPWIGMGTYAITDLVRDRMQEAILGGESVWYGLLINKGLLGIIAYISLYIFSFVHIRSLKFDALMFLCLQLLINTLTSIPGYDASVFLCFVLMARKVYDLFGKGRISKINNINQLLIHRL